MPTASSRGISVAAATLQRVEKSIQLARKILESCPHMIASRRRRRSVLQKEQGIILCKPEELVSEAEQEAWMKCKADKHAARTSSRPRAGNRRRCSHGSAMADYLPRRPPAELASSSGPRWRFAAHRLRLLRDSEPAAFSCTGYGEAIMKIVMAKTAVDLFVPERLASIPLQQPNACDLSPRISRRANPFTFLATHACHRRLILLDRHGNPGFAFNTPRMAYGYVALDGQLRHGRSRSTPLHPHPMHECEKKGLRK